MGPGLAELRAAVAAQGIATTGPWFDHCFRRATNTFDFEVCLPFAARVAPVGRVKNVSIHVWDIRSRVQRAPTYTTSTLWMRYLGVLLVAALGSAEGQRRLPA